MGALVFLVAMSESLLVIGMIVPGAALMVAFGALVESGVMDFWTTCAWAVLGAVAGDGLSFGIGRVFKDSLPNWWPFKKHPQWIAGGESFFRMHGGKSIVFGRFVGPVRAVIPAVAGMMGMPPGRFFAYNVLSAVAWAPIYLLPGIAFAASLELAGQVAPRLALVLGLAVLLMVGTVWVARHLYRWGVPHLGNWTRAVLQWSGRHPVLGKPTRALVDPDHAETPALAMLGLGLIGGPALLLTALRILAGGGPPSALDALILDASAQLHAPAGEMAARALRAIGSPWTLVTLGGLTLMTLLVQRARFTAAHWSAALLFAVAAELAVGAVTPGPVGLLVPIPPGAYGAFAAPVMYGFAAVLAASGLPDQWRWLPYTAAALLVMALLCALLYLGFVWFSETLLGAVVGGAWVVFLAAAYRTRPGSAEHPRRLALLVLVSISVGIFWAVSRPALELPSYASAAKAPAPTLDRAVWWSGNAVRPNAAGRQAAPPIGQGPTLEWAEAASEIRTDLMKQGWRPAPAFRWLDLLNTLSPEVNVRTLPVLPRVHQGQHGQIRMVRELPDESTRLVVRFWLDARLEPGALPLWLGQVSLERAVRRGGLIIMIKSQPVSPDRLDLSQVTGLELKTVHRDSQSVLLIARSPVTR